METSADNFFFGLLPFTVYFRIMPATIKDIAQSLGISPSTVSRALNDHPQIKDETKKAVREMARKLHYSVNQAASGLRTNKTFSLGVVVPQISNYFFSSVLGGMQKVASENDYQLLICQTNEKEDEELRYVQSLVSGRVDGLLMSISQETQNFDRLAEILSDTPVVLFDRTSEKIPTIHVEAEDYRGAYLATRHLISRGPGKIAHLGGPRKLTVSQNRLRGYKDALEENNISFDPGLLAHCEFDIKKVPEAVDKILAAHPEVKGIFAVNDEIAIEAILALKKKNIRIPEDIAVVGFGDYPIARIVEPNLTTISHYPAKIGERATHHLLKLINHREEAAVMKEVIPCELINRDSA